MRSRTSGLLELLDLHGALVDHRPRSAARRAIARKIGPTVEDLRLSREGESGTADEATFRKGRGRAWRRRVAGAGKSARQARTTDVGTGPRRRRWWCVW